MAKDTERPRGPVDLILVQHGQAEDEVRQIHGGWLDFPLTPLGARQMKAVAERLRREGRGFDVLYTSSLQRAVESAEILGRALGLEPVREERLRSFNRGDLTGLSHQEANARFPGAWARRWGAHERPVPNAETRVEFATRAVRAAEAIVRRHAGGRVVAVTHGGVIRAVVRRWFGVAPWEVPGASIASDPAAVTHLRVTADGRREIVTVNDGAHLADLRE